MAEMREWVSQLSSWPPRRHLRVAFAGQIRRRLRGSWYAAWRRPSKQRPCLHPHCRQHCFCKPASAMADGSAVEAREPSGGWLLQQAPRHSRMRRQSPLLCRQAARLRPRPRAPVRSHFQLQGSHPRLGMRGLPNTGGRRPSAPSRPARACARCDVMRCRRGRHVS